MEMATGHSGGISWVQGPLPLRAAVAYKTGIERNWLIWLNRRVKGRPNFSAPTNTVSLLAVCCAHLVTEDRGSIAQHGCLSHCSWIVLSYFRLYKQQKTLSQRVVCIWTVMTQHFMGIQCSEWLFLM